MHKTLRPYQKDIIDRAKKAKDNILIQAPTGSGKTLIAEKIVAHNGNKNMTSLFLAPKLNLLDQTAKAFENLNPQIIHGSNKKPIDENASTFVSTIQTISRRPELLEKMKFDYIILDEMHYGAKGKMQEVIKNSHAGKVIGLSATPYDSEGKLLTDDFDTIINDYDAKYMVANGYLVDIVSYEAYTPDLQGVKIKQGDWDMKELDHRFNTPQVITKVISATKDIIQKRDRTIVFCINIAHAEAMSDAYENAGISAAVTHSEISKELQEQRLQMYKNGKLKVLVSVDQLTTGFDVPATDTIVLARATQSQNLYKQIVGRALRVSPETNKTDAVLLDCGGVVSRLGLPLEPIEYKAKKSRVAKPYFCEECGSTKPRETSIINDKKELVSICPTCKNIKEWKNNLLYDCKECKRFYSYQSDKALFDFTSDDYHINCLCGSKIYLGSINDLDIGFKIVTDKEAYELKKSIAENPDTPLKILKSYAEFESDKVRHNVANNENINEEIFLILSTDKSRYIRATIARHKNIPTKILVQLADDGEYLVRESVAKTPNLPADILENMVRDEHHSVREGAAQNPNLSSHLIEELSEDKYYRIRKCIAERENCPMKILKKLSKDSDKDVRRGVAKNENCPSDMLELLIDDNNNNGIHSINYDIAEHQNLSITIAKKLSYKQNFDIRLQLAYNPNCPISILEYIVQDKKILSMIKGNATVYASARDILLRLNK